MTEISKQPRTKGLFLPPLLQLILSGIGLCISLLISVLFILGGVFGNAVQGIAAGSTSLFSTGISSLLIGLLFLVPLVQSVQQLSGKETRFSQKSYLRIAIILMLLWVPLLFLGQWINNTETPTWLWLPLLNFILIASPIFFLIELARRNLSQPAGSAPGVFTFGVVLTHPLVLLIELAGLLGLAALAIGWVNTQPALMDEINRLGQRLMDVQMDPVMMEKILLPYLQKPEVILSVLFAGAGLVPLVEELLKPLALWVMIGRKLDEPAGFVLGLFAGGTFALLESLGISVSSFGQDWASIITARLGTGILHITTTALMGWGLAAAWSSRKYLRLGLTFLVSFSLHAVWNVLGIYSGFQQYISGEAVTLLTSIGYGFLTVLAAGMVIILLAVNRYLRKIDRGEHGEQSGILSMSAADVQPASHTDDVLENE